MQGFGILSLLVWLPIAGGIAVLALGDTAYVNFCQTGRLIDARIEALGGARAADRQDLDLDFQKAAAAWTDKALEVFAPADAAPANTVVHVDFKGAPAAEDDDEPRFTAENPIEAEIAALINLNGTGSTRETWHAEFAVGDPGFVYKPGDAIGLYPENDPALAEDLLKAVGLAGDDALKQKLVTSFDITTLSRPAVDGYAKLTGRKDVAALLEDGGLATFAADRQLVDLFESFPEKLSADQLTKLLRPLPGRLYSVASSLKAHAGEAHLLVGAVRWTSHGRARNGVTSTFLADRCKVGGNARIYVKPNKHFGLPADGDRPIVMIGAGTGVAPYRGFIEERAEAGDKGKSWLFFGERNFSYDFLYQLEWQDHLASGALSNIDVAPSQVLLEATIAEVTLNDQLRFGLRWFFETQASQFRLTDSALGSVTPRFPGFSYFLNMPNVKIALNALSDVTDVNVVSSPSMMVLDNKRALLQIGDEVPIATQSAVSTGTPDAPIVNAISFRSTGVILGITPRVGDNGRILLDIEQEVSDVVPTTSSTIDSPTIQQRRIKTTVAVTSGESIVLAGFMQDRASKARQQVPLVGDVPWLGNLFKDKNDTIRRTELLIAITPQVVKDPSQIRGIAAEFRDRINLTTRPQRATPPDRREQVDRVLVR